MSGSDKVVPPKKSKAARKTEVLLDETPGVESTEVQEQNGHVDDPGKVSDAASGSGQDQETPVNIFQQQIVEGKRKRNAPLAEQTLQDWLKKNFVEKENTYLVPNDMYQAYLETCSSVAAFAVDYTNFHKAVAQMFPKGQSLVEDSPYKDTIREKKPKKKKSPAKIQADSLHLKMRDILKEAITDLGNPRKGIGFSAIKTLVAGKFPALRVDLRVNILKNAIFRELRFGHIECVRGIGACGYYRLPRTPEQEAEELEAEKKEAQEKALKKKGKKDAESGEEKTDENAEKTGAESENAEKKEEEKPAETEEESKEKPAKKKKKKTKKHKKPQREYYLTHSEPQRIEDTFALAMTYNSEPKEASVAKIRKYIKDFYKEDISIEKLKKCLDTGVEHGFWFQVTGQTTGSGSFRLTINEFDPLADDDLTGKVMNAIVACTEPKQSSAMLLKKYVQDYHPNFRVAERPHLFKMALQRGVNKNKIVQLSGIGATGSFQLVDPFLPSPTVLQGKDATSDYGASDGEVGGDVEAFQDAYKPRPTKGRGKGRPSATAIRRLDLSATASVPRQMGSRGPKSRGVKKTVTGRGGRNTGKRNVSSSDEESEGEESEEELPPKKAASPVKRKAPAASSAAGKAKKAKVVPSSVKKPTARRSTAVAASTAKKAASESESEEYDSEPEAYTPRRTASRGGSSAPSAGAGRAGRGGKARTVPTPVRKAPAPVKGKKKGGKDQSEEEKEDSEEEKPQVTPSRKGKPAGKGKGARKGKKPKTPVKKTPVKGKAKEQSESESEEEPAALPITPKSVTQSGRRLGSAARMRAQPPSEDDDEKKESNSSKLAKSAGLKVTVVLTSPKRGSAGSGKQVHKVTNISPVVNLKRSEDVEEEDKMQDKAKKPKFGKSAAAGKKKKGGKKAKSRK